MGIYPIIEEGVAGTEAGGEGPVPGTTGGDVAGVELCEKTALCLMGSPPALLVGGGGGGILVPMVDERLRGLRAETGRVCGGVPRASAAGGVARVACPLVCVCACPFVCGTGANDGCLVGGGGALLTGTC